MEVTQEQFDAAVKAVERFIYETHRFDGSDPRLEVSIYTYGANGEGDLDRSPQCGVRVSEVSTYLRDAENPNMGAGGSWMQVDAPHGIAVCAQAERCIVAQLEDWDQSAPGEIKDEFWRLGHAMFQDNWTGEVEQAGVRLAPGESYQEDA